MQGLLPTHMSQLTPAVTVDVVEMVVILLVLVAAVVLVMVVVAAAVVVVVVVVVEVVAVVVLALVVKELVNLALHSYASRICLISPSESCCLLPTNCMLSAGIVWKRLPVFE